MAFQNFTVSIVRGRSASLVLGALGFCGCAVIGPQSITAGRAVYTEVINRTEDEQILNVLVRLRYDETFGMMSVASVTHDRHGLDARECGGVDSGGRVQ